MFSLPTSCLLRYARVAHGSTKIGFSPLTARTGSLAFLRCASALPGARVWSAILLGILSPGISLASDEVVGGSESSSIDWDLRGRLQVDGARFNSDNLLFTDDFQIRRARLALIGKWSFGLSMKLEYEFGGDSLRPKSLYFRKKLGENGEMTVGHFKVPVSLQTATSSLNNSFMERSLPNVGTTGYRLGMMATTYGDFWSASSGIIGGRLSGEYEVGNEGLGFFARGVLNPVRSKNHLWHFGLSSEIRRYGTGDTMRLRSRPESDLTDIRLVDTQRIDDLDQSFRYTAEFAWKRKSIGVQAEYMGFKAKRLIGPDLDFSGWYVQAGWFISGESRRYNRRKGRFRKTIPEGRFGAWEVAFRYSTVDLNSFDILGGEETNRSVALNWYTTKSLRFSLNYIDATARSDMFSAAENLSIIQARFQFTF